MEDFSSLTSEDRPVVNIVASPSGLAMSLAELLLGNFCRVNIISGKNQAWENLSFHLSQNNNLRITPLDKNTNENCDYLVYISELFSKVDEKEVKNLEEKESDVIEKIFEIKTKKKVLLIFPYQV